jgi:hypothetical protein
MLKKEPFDESRFARRRKQRVGDVEAYLSSPEDTILMKLSWARQLGGSTKQLLDAQQVVELQGEALEDAYLQRWATLLGVSEDLQKIRRARGLS